MSEAPSVERTATPPIRPAVHAETAEILRDLPRTAPKRPRNWRRTILFALLPIALIAGFYFYVTGGQVMSTENAYVRADIVAVSTDISGIVKDVAVRENQHVQTGDVLFRLDDLPFRLALDRANAQLATTVTAIDALRASYRDMQAQIRQAEVDTAYFEREKDRQQSLLASRVASVSAFDLANRAWMASVQHQASLQQQLNVIVANLAGNPEIKTQDHPRYREALAQRDEAARQLDHTVIRAPFAGVVSNVPSLQPGQYLQAATPAFSVVAADHVWIDANPKETELTWVRPGQSVSITVDTYPGEVWKGVVDGISPASAASYAMLPAQNTSGNWVKVVQRIPMRVRVETPAGMPQLRAGMSVVLGVDTGHARGLPSFIADALHSVGLGASAQTPTAHHD